MLKAFLCHCSKDKYYVDIVARRLGRGRIQYDSMCFEPGVEFLESIREHLKESVVFVFFASQHSLQSLWVKFEIREAEDLLRQEALKSSLALIVDDETREDKLPKWMRRGLVDRVRQPSRAARIIEIHLNRVRGLEREALFIGRESLLGDFAAMMIPAPEKTPANLITVGGLSGVGRRTFLQRALKDTLSLNMGPIFVLEATDGIDTLHSLLLGELGELDTKSQLEAVTKSFLESSVAEKGEEIARMLAGVAVGNTTPMIVDNGAFLDPDTRYTDEAYAIFQGLKNHKDTVVALVHLRRPNLEEMEWKSINAIYVRVPPLDLQSTALLLNQSFRRAGIATNTEQMEELCRYMDGYPPAIGLVVSLAKEYGLPIVIADKSMLIDFKIRTFAQVLQKLPLESEDWEILRVLASEPVLPLEGLSIVSGVVDESLVKRLRRLIDFNLVLPIGEHFGISPPIAIAVSSLRGSISDAEFGEIARRLRAKFWTDPEKLPDPEITKTFIHAVSRSNVSELKEFTGILLPSVLYKAAKENYDKGGQEAWEAGRDLANIVLGISPHHKRVCILLFKIQVRLNEWAEAEKILADIKKKGYVEQHYLNGFLLWKRAELDKAVIAFGNAISVGHTSPEVYHGLAHCLFRLGKVPEAQEVVKKGLRGRRPNKLLLDLAAQITITLGLYDEAEDYIDQLKRLGEDLDYHHRLSTLLSVRKQFREALQHAERACETPRCRFEILANRVDVRIELGDFPKAQSELAELDRQYRIGSDKHDVRTGLRCKLFLRIKQWKDAEKLWRELVFKNSAVHLGLRAEILRQKIDDVEVSPGERFDAQRELGTIAVAGPENVVLLVEPEEADIGGQE